MACNDVKITDLYSGITLPSCTSCLSAAAVRLGIDGTFGGSKCFASSGSSLFENEAFSIAMMATAGFFLFITVWLLYLRYSSNTPSTRPTPGMGMRYPPPDGNVGW